MSRPWMCVLLALWLIAWSSAFAVAITFCQVVHHAVLLDTGIDQAAWLTGGCAAIALGVPIWLGMVWSVEWIVTRRRR
jgi:fatty acid desaturase